MVDYNGSYYAYVHTLQGDIGAIVDNTGTKVVEYGYDAWGKPTKVWSLTHPSDSTLTSAYAKLAQLNPFRYRGYVWDEETGLYSLRSRYYDPVWGRFINEDSHIKTSEILGPNIFSYCKNSPVMRFDPNGKSSEWLFALRHPVIAFNIGRVIEGRRNMNISTTAVRFAINLGLKNPASAEGEGTQVNAMRHALWTSLISSRYGTNIAREAVRSHEEIEMLAFGDALQTMPEEQLSGMVLGMRWVADSMCDYLNNEIALQRTWDNMPGNEICSDILDIYHDTGLWIAVAADNGFMLYKERLSDEQYMMAKECLKQLDAFGFVIE